MEFRDYIYLDTNALNQYCEQLGIEKKFETNITSKSKKGVKGSGRIPLLKAEGEVETENTKSYTQKNSETEMLLAFEKEAKKKNDLIDFKGDISKIKRGSIVVFDAEIQIPKNFQMLLTAKRFWPIIESQIPDSQKSQNNVELVGKLMGSCEFDNAPVFAKIGESHIYGKLKTEFFLQKYSCNDLPDETVTILAKVDGICADQEGVEIFNMQQDILNVNKQLLESMNNAQNAEQSYKVGAPAIKLAVLAIYK